MPTAVVRVDRAGVIREVIQEQEGRAPVPARNWEGMSYHDLLPRELSLQLDGLIGVAIDRWSLASISRPIVWDGEEHFLDIRLVPLGPDEVYIFLVDESERHRSERSALRLNRALLALHSAASAVTISLSVEQVLDTFAWELTSMLDAGGCAVFGRKEAEQPFTLLAAHSASADAAFAAAFAEQMATFPLALRVLEERYARQVTRSDAEDALPERAYLRHAGLEAMLLMPLVYQDQTHGLVQVIGKDERPFSDQEISLALLLSNQAAGAVANAQSHEETEQQLRAQTVLRQASQIFSASLERQKVLDSIVEQLCQTLHATSAYIRSFEREATASLLAAAYIDAEAVESDAHAPVGARAVHAPELFERLSAGEPLVWQAGGGDVPGEDAARFERAGARSALMIPMIRAGRVVAVAELWESRRARAFTRSEIGLAQGIAQIAAVALENAGLYQRARREIAERERAEAELEAERTGLAERVAEKTAELRRANAELARAARLKDEFLASMSHELRTPLNAILGIAEGMADQLYGPLNERQIRSLALVEQSGRHLLSLIDDILDVSKIESGQLSLDIALIPVSATVQSCLQLIRQNASNKGIDIAYRTDREVTHLRADGRRLKQILINLLSNAVKFTPENGSIGIDVVGEPELNRVAFTVWDTGIGIHESDLARLFTPFVQLDSSLARRYNGTGLGLALVKRLTELHGGVVSVDSKPGEGSRFTVTLPWRAADPGESSGIIEGAESPRAAATRPLSALHPDSRPLILLAEDDDVNAEVFVSCIKSMGLRVAVARDGEEALTRLGEERPSLILMDIQMPGMSGLDVIREIRKRPDMQPVPIIALTALAMAGDRERCLEAGASDYLSKPVPLRQLRKIIRAHLEAAGIVTRGEGE